MHVLSNDRGLVHRPAQHDVQLRQRHHHHRHHLAGPALEASALRSACASEAKSRSTGMGAWISSFRILDKFLLLRHLSLAAGRKRIEPRKTSQVLKASECVDHIGTSDVGHNLELIPYAPMPRYLSRRPRCVRLRGRLLQ